MSDEGGSLGGRLGRYARVGTSVGGLAVKLAGQRYLGLGIDRDRHAAELKAALGGLKGPLMKAAQLIATIPDAVPPEYARELARTKRVSPERFDRLLARHGERWLVELTAAAHFYVFLSGVANAFDVPVPDDGDRLG